MGFEIEPKGQGWGPLGCQGAAASCQAPVIGHLWRPTLPISSLGPSQEDEERYTLRILTLVSLKGFLMDGLSWRDCRVGEETTVVQNYGQVAGQCRGAYSHIQCVRAQSRPTLCDPMDCSPRGSCVRGILQASRLEQVAVSSSRGPSRPRDQNCLCVSCIGGWILYLFTTAPPGKPPSPAVPW